MDLTNQFIIAMPKLNDPVFKKTVTYICQHNNIGSLGITINQPLNMNIKELYHLIGMELIDQSIANLPIFFGGPVEVNQGFVLHTSDKSWSNSLIINEDFTLSSSKDVLLAISHGEGPEKFLISLGCAGWGIGQIEQEMLENSWINCIADKNIMFELEAEKRYKAAADLIGFDINLISSDVGHG